MTKSRSSWEEQAPKHAPTHRGPISISHYTTQPVMLKRSRLAGFLNVVMMPLALLLVVLVIAGVHGPIRMWLTLAVFTFGPGSALVQFFRLPDRALQLGIIIGISGAVDIAVAQGLLWLHDIDKSAAVLILAAFTCLRPLGRVPSTRSELQ